MVKTSTLEKIVWGGFASLSLLIGIVHLGNYLWELDNCHGEADFYQFY